MLVILKTFIIFDEEKWYSTCLKTLVAKQRLKCLDLLKSVFSLDHYFY